MLRIQAVKSLLVEEVAGIALPRETAPCAEETAHLLRELGRACRKALFIVALCWGAITILLATHPQRVRFLGFEELETVFTLGILLVATYAGFRLGQWEKYRAVRRVVEELAERGEARASP